MKRKIMITVSEEDLAIIDKYAKSHLQTRTAFILNACRYFLKQEEALEGSKNLVSLVDILLESDIQLDADTKKKLEALKTLSADLKSFKLDKAFD